MELVIPGQHLRFRVGLHSPTIDGSVGVADIRPEAPLSIGDFFLLFDITPAIGETLQPGTFGRSQPADDTTATNANARLARCAAPG